MVNLIFKRILLFFPILFISFSTYYFIIRFAPNTPFSNMNNIKVAKLHKLEERYKSNSSLSIQYLHYMKNLFTGDFGYSFRYPNIKIINVLKNNYLPTFIIVLCTFLLSSFLALLLSLTSEIIRNEYIDLTLRILTSFFMATPSVVLAPIIIFIFIVKLDWADLGGFNNIKEYIFPILILSSIFTSRFYNHMRMGINETLKKNFVKFAHAQGLSLKKIIVFYVLPTGMVPYISIIPTSFMAIFSGTIIVESQFNIKGLGVFIVEAANSNDFPLIIGILVLTSIFVLVITLLTDILQIKLGQKEENEIN